MPRGPNGERRPADAIGCAVMVGRMATGEVVPDQTSGRRRSGLAGAEARKAVTTNEQRKAIAEKAARVRWSVGHGSREGAV